MAPSVVAVDLDADRLAWAGEIDDRSRPSPATSPTRDLNAPRRRDRGRPVRPPRRRCAQRRRPGQRRPARPAARARSTGRSRSTSAACCSACGPRCRRCAPRGGGRIVVTASTSGIARRPVDVAVQRGQGGGHQPRRAAAAIDLAADGDHRQRRLPGADRDRDDRRASRRHPSATRGCAGPSRCSAGAGPRRSPP